MSTATVILPFGRHKGQELSTVPASYLRYAIETMKLSSGLRAAVAAELERRGVTAPAAPPPAPVPECQRCGRGSKVRYSWMQFADGRRQIKRTCGTCGGSLGFAAQVEPYLTLANQATLPAPMLDVLTRCEELGIELVNDGTAVSFRTSADKPWRNIPQDLRDALYQCRHSLASHLPVNWPPAAPDGAGATPPSAPGPKPVVAADATGRGKGVLP